MWRSTLVVSSYFLVLLALFRQPRTVLSSTTDQVSADSPLPDCLHASPPSPGSTDQCEPDPKGLSNSAMIEAAEATLGLAPTDLEFTGCRNALFQTTVARTIPGLALKVTYPILPGVDLPEYVAPIVHELCHVYQLKQAGGFSRLEEQLNPYFERAELGADFLTGVVLRGLSLPTSTFELSKYVSGSYKRNLSAPHGVPHERTSAFRLGYFFDRRVTDLGTKYRFFQDDLFATLRPSS